MEPFVPRLERGDVMLACLGVGLVVRVEVKFRVGVRVGAMAMVGVGGQGQGRGQWFRGGLGDAVPACV